MGVDSIRCCSHTCSDLVRIWVIFPGTMPARSRGVLGSVMLHPLWRVGLTAPLAVVVGGLVPLPVLASAPSNPACSGTVLQLSVQEQASGVVDRFRFSLGLSGEGTSEAEALRQLNQRLGRLRADLNPLINGPLTVPAPRSHQRGGGTGAAPRRFVATTTLSGEVGRRHYDALIQLAGRRTGVRLQGMSSLAEAGASQTQEQALVRWVLERGLKEAEAIGRSIGRSRVNLQHIDRRGAIQRPVQARMASPSMAFDPQEAPKPRVTVHLQLTYCLS